MNETLDMFYTWMDKSETESLIERIDDMTEDYANGAVMSALIHTLMLTHLGSLEDESGKIDRLTANQYLVELSQTLRVLQDDFFSE